MYKAFPVHYVAGLLFQGEDSERVADTLGLDFLDVLRKGQSLDTHGHGIPAFEARTSTQVSLQSTVYPAEAN
jgi:hypothetical protein